ncbi:MAG: LamG domain-containing protein [Ignavibacteriae bacterium]|nr:LamG domain-containing protein [Ignavibacteriota bacterium]NOG98651.1 LamG domain-containing protein [Ignavibacteriota bacterium]
MKLTFLFAPKRYIKTIICGLLFVLIFGCDNGVEIDKVEEPKNYIEYGKVITDDLIAYYPFDGSAMDYSENELHGIENGVEATAGRFNQANGALSFDGVDDFIEIPQFSEINNSSGTICFWARIPSGIQRDNDAAVISRIDTVGEGFTISIHGTSYYWFEYRTVFGSESGANMHTYYWEDNEYLFIAVTFSKGIDTTSTTFTYYFQGHPTIEVKNTAMDQNFTFNDSSMPLFIGKSLIPRYSYLKGELDDLLVYDRALSDGEILELFSWE